MATSRTIDVQITSEPKMWSANHLIKQDPQKIKDDSYLKIYELYRKYVEHEDQLTNHRMTWANVVQGTVLAAFGFIVHRIVYFREKYYDLIWNIRTRNGNPAGLDENRLREHFTELMVNYNFFLFVVVIFGLVQSAISAPLIFLATRAIRGLKDQYIRTIFALGPLPFPMPGLTDGGRKTSGLWGYLIFTPPVLFIVFWFCSLFYISAATSCLKEPLLPIPPPESSKVDATAYVGRLSCVKDVPSRIWDTLFGASPQPKAPTAPTPPAPPAP